MQRHEERRPQAPVAPVVQNPAMESLLKEVFSRFSPELGYAVDYVVLTLKPQDLREACSIARSDPRLRFDFLSCLSVVEYPDRFQAVYHLYSTEKHHTVIFKTNVPKDKPVFPSVISVWKGADWHEREEAELFGVSFEGHPNLKHLLLYDSFEGYPLLKSYPFAEIEDK